MRIKDGTRLYLDSAYLNQIFRIDNADEIKAFLACLIKQQEKYTTAPEPRRDTFTSRKPNEKIILEISPAAIIGEYTAEILLQIINNYCKKYEKIIVVDTKEKDTVKFKFENKRFKK